MNWPTDSTLIEYMAKVTAVFALGLILSRLLKRNLRLRQVMWALCFLVPLWLLLPLPRLSLPLLEGRRVAPSPTPHVYELAPGFSPFRTERMLDHGPSWLLLALLALTSMGLIVLSIRWIGTLHLIREAEQVVDDEQVATLYELGQQHGLADVPMLKISDKLDSPCVWGVVQPVIVLPTSFSDLSPDEWRLVLHHEVVHLSQRDPLRLLFYSLVQYSFWWNPLIWFGLQDALLAQERAIDDQVGQSKGYAKLLTRTVVPVAGGPRLRFMGQGHLLTRMKALADPQAGPTSSWQMGALLAFVPLAIPFDLVTSYHPDPKRIGFEEIVFQSDRTGVLRLWRSASDGRNPQPMSDHFIKAGVPTLSPDGEWFTYTRLKENKEDIFICRVDGTGERRVVSSPERDVQGAWSPDGSKLVYCTMATGNWEIGLCDLNTGQNRFITKDGKRNLEPSWHPNGERVIFSSHRAGPQNIWSMNLDGSDLTQLTAMGTEDTAARYSRDGRQVLFSSYRRSKYEVLLLDLASGTAQALSPRWLAEAGEPRFIEGDQAVVMSTNTGSGLRLARYDLLTGQFERFSSKSSDFWPVTR